MRFSRLLSAFCLLGLSSLAHADTFQQFIATNINFYQSPSMPAATGSLTGGIVVDTTMGTVTSSTLQFNAVSGTTYSLNRTGVPSIMGVTENLSFCGANTALYLFIPGNLVNYTGGQVCYYPAQASCTQPNGISQSSFIQIGNGPLYNPYSGSFSPGSLVVAATPEPSGLLLLSTCALSVAGFVRRKCVATRNA